MDAAQLLRERLQALERGLNRVRRAHQKHSSILDQCEGCEKQGSDIVAGAVDRCQLVSEELMTLWQNIMALRQVLHTLPMGMRVSVSPVGVERDISNLQDDHTELESRCARILALLKSRLVLWRRFEKQLEMVQQSVQEADYMMELLTVQGSVDYDRLIKATERLEVSSSCSFAETFVKISRYDSFLNIRLIKVPYVTAKLLKVPIIKVGPIQILIIYYLLLLLLSQLWVSNLPRDCLSRSSYPGKTYLDRSY